MLGQALDFGKPSHDSYSAYRVVNKWLEQMGYKDMVTPLTALESLIEEDNTGPLD